MTAEIVRLVGIVEQLGTASTPRVADVAELTERHARRLLTVAEGAGLVAREGGVWFSTDEQTDIPANTTTLGEMSVSMTPPADVTEERLAIAAEGCRLHPKASVAQMMAAGLAHAKSAKAVLVVAKLDRLARNVAFLSALMESGVEFIACDNPHASRLTIHILAAVAEDEARRISERTKGALKAARARGTKLGSSRPGHWKGREDRRQLGAKRGTVAAAKARTAKAAEHNRLVLTIIGNMRAAGSTWQSIADELTVQGHETPRGRAWSAPGVYQLSKQLKSAA